MFSLLTAFFLGGADQVLGTNRSTERMLAESRARNERQRQAVYAAADSVNDILAQTAFSGRLVAEQMRIDNLRLEREISAERRMLEDSPGNRFPL